MSNRIKNSIILGMIFFLISGFGFFHVNLSKGSDLKRFNKMKLNKEKELVELEAAAAALPMLKDSLNYVMKEFYKNDKIIPSNDESRTAFKYLNALSSPDESNIKFSFTTGPEKKYDDYIEREYHLEGDAPFYNFYNFIWKLENYKRLYSIRSVSLEEIKKIVDNNKSPKSYVRYNMRISGYSLKENLYKNEDITDKKYPKDTVYNPFLPLVKENLPPNSRGYLVVTDAKLQGLSRDKAFLTDGKGRMRVMKTGDKVYLGYLTLISVERNFVEFTLNKGGFLEKVKLELTKNK